MTAIVSKAPSCLGSTYICVGFKGIDTSNGDCYVNGRGLHYEQETCFKVANQTLFKTTGEAKLALLDFANLTKEYGRYFGLFDSVEELKESSARDVFLFDPLIGFPFFKNVSNAFPILGVKIHTLSFETLTRPLDELLVKFDGCKFVGRGSSGLPMRIRSRSEKNVRANEDLTLNSNFEAQAVSVVYYLGDDEIEFRSTKKQTQRFRKEVRICDDEVKPETEGGKHAIDLNVKGFVTDMFFTFQSQNDIALGNWTRQCNEEGSDYVSDIMVTTGGVNREDGLPASYYRSIKHIEAFGHDALRHTYHFSFEAKSNVPQFTGGQNFELVAKPQVVFHTLPHADTLVVKGYATAWNSFWHDKGKGGVLWSDTN